MSQRDDVNAGNRSKKFGLKSGLGLLAMLAAGGLLGYATGRITAGSASGLRSVMDALSPWDLLALPVLVLAVIAVHEAGHLLMGLRQGMRFLLYVVGPFGLVGGGEGIRFRWFFNLGTLGGLAAAMPDPQRPLAAQMKPMVLGGPLASLLLAIGGFVVMAIGDGRFAAYALIVGLLSAAIFVVTALPFRAGGFMSDGMQWLAYRRGGAGIARRARLTTLMGMSMAGIRPRALDAETLRLALEAADGSEALTDMGAWFYAYARDLDRGEVEAADTWLKKMADALGAYPDGFRQSIAIELAIHSALHRRDLAEASRWLRSARGGIVDAARRHLAEAAMAALQGDAAGAEKLLVQADKRLKQSMDPGFALLSRDQIDALRRTLAVSSGATDSRSSR
ncbi:MAG: site-2 protease family protein [Pseudoxanthomonas sp.]